MNNLTLWVLSIGGINAGAYILSAMFILFYIITVISYHNNNYSNRWLSYIYRWRRVTLWSVLVITYVTIYFYFSTTFDAPTLWFKNLPALEIGMIKKEILKHDEPLSIRKFYDIQNQFISSVQQDNYKHAQLNAMNED